MLTFYQFSDGLHFLSIVGVVYHFLRLVLISSTGLADYSFAYVLVIVQFCHYFCLLIFEMQLLLAQKQTLSNIVPFFLGSTFKPHPPTFS